MDFDIDNEKIIIEKDGKKVEYKILFTFDSEDTMKSYVGYTDDSIGSNGRKNIFVSSYSPFDGKKALESITDEKELAMVNEVLEQIDRESNS